MLFLLGLFTLFTLLRAHCTYPLYGLLKALAAGRQRQPPVPLVTQPPLARSFTLVVGAPCSGKSMYIAAVQHQTRAAYTVLSVDALIDQAAGRPDWPAEQYASFRPVADALLAQRLDAALRDGQSVLYETTGADHAVRRLRRAMIAARRANYSTHVVFMGSPAARIRRCLLHRNRQQHRQVSLETAQRLYFESRCNEPHLTALISDGGEGWQVSVGA